MKRIADPSNVAAAIFYLLADATFSAGVILSADDCQSVA